MNHVQYALMITLFFAMGQGLIHYTQIANTTILKNLAIYHNINIGVCWMLRCRRRLEDDGMINRRTRFKRYNNNQIQQRPSLIRFTPKGARWLTKNGFSGAKKLLKTILAFLKSSDKRWPAEQDLDDDTSMPPDPNEAARLRRLAETVGKDVS